MTTTFSIHATPVGDALVVLDDNEPPRLIGLEILEAPLGIALEPWAARLHATPVHDQDAGADIARQLDEYFEGERVTFDIEIDLALVSGFTLRALEAICEIPYGETASYGEVAAVAGNPGAHRAAGTACGRTPISIVLPVHRVVRSDGSIGEYGGRPEIKRFLLDLEAAHRPS